MNYLSVCSGIEAASVAWHSLGWQPVGFAEVDSFCSALLKYRYPEVKNFGDFTSIQKGDIPAIPLLVGGTPCQSFSVAGQRAGLDDPRGNLALEFIRLAKRIRPRWILWENVPGVMSSEGWRDFGTILGALGQCGYGFAYRILDAQYFGVPQRRRRVFVVGYFGDWRPAAAVLFEQASLSRNIAPSREEGKGTAAYAVRRSQTGSNGWGINDHTAHSVDTTEPEAVAFAVRSSASRNMWDGADNLVPTLTGNGDAHSGFKNEHGLVAYKKRGGFGWSESANVSPTLESESGTHQGGPEHIPVIIHENKSNSISQNESARALRSGASHSYQFLLDDHGGQRIDILDETAPTLRSEAHNHIPAVCAVDLQNTQLGDEVGYSLDTTRPSRGGGQGVMSGMSVRRLTPRECERLQGFSDDYTLIPYRGKPAADGPRYKALGNSMAVPVMKWLGERIKLVEAIITL